MITSLTGALPVVILFAAAFSPVVSLALIRWYRHSLVTGMQLFSHHPLSAGSASSPDMRPPLGRIEFTELRSQPGLTDRSTLTLLAVQRIRAQSLAYVVAGTCCATVLASAYVWAGRGSLESTAVLLMTAVFVWPAIMCLHLLLPLGRRIRVSLIAGYAGVFVLSLFIPVFEDASAYRVQAVIFALLLNLGFTLLATILLWRRIRAVGAMVFVFLLACLSGPVLGIEALRLSPGLQATASEAASAGTGVLAAVALVLLAAAALFAVGGWYLLRVTGYWYEQRLISDLSILTDSVWLAYLVINSILLVFQGIVWILTFIPAFALYKLILAAGLACVNRLYSIPRPPPRMLELRVFSLGDNSARLFTALTAYWRQVGVVSLIAGPDLAATAVEPHEFLSFLSRRLKDLFIEDPSAFSQRLLTPDVPDPDGRFRVSEFFCRADTWKPVVEQLVSRSDVVLMDLRQFSTGHSGCEQELCILLNHVPMQRVVLVIDHTTDRDHLTTVLERSWREISLYSPNRTARPCRVALFHLEILEPEGMLNLVQALSMEARPANPALAGV